MCEPNNDNTDPDNPFGESQFSENVEEVFMVSLPVVETTRFSCHLCTKFGQNLKSHGSLKKHFHLKHNDSVIIRFECRQCQAFLPSVKSYTSHATTCIIQPPPPEPEDRAKTPEYDAFSSTAIERFIADARERSSPERVPSPGLHPTEISCVASRDRLSPVEIRDTVIDATIPTAVCENPASPECCITPQEFLETSLWNWKGITNVLGNDQINSPNNKEQKTYISNDHRFHQSTTPAVTPDILHARKVFFQSPPSPEFLQGRLIIDNDAVPTTSTINDFTPPQSMTNDNGIPHHASPPAAAIDKPIFPSQLPASIPVWNAEFNHPPPVRSNRGSSRPSTVVNEPPRERREQTGTPRSRPSKTAQGGRSFRRTAHQKSPQTARESPNGSLAGDDAAEDETNQSIHPANVPKLTPQQTAWLARLDAMDETDLVGINTISLEITKLAVESQQTTGQINNRRPRTEVPHRPPRPRRPAPARPRFDAGEASNIQKLYRTDRKKAMNHICSGAPSPHCHVDKERIRQHLSDIFAQNNHEWSDPPEEVPDLSMPSSPAERQTLISNITPKIVASRLARMNVTAPGPDGARYSGLRRADPGCHVMAKLYNRCMRMGRVPQEWKDSTTVLVHKGGNRDDLHNWRPLMLSNTIGKLYSAVLADRISTWASDGGRLSSEQKGFTDHEGCLEHNFVLQTAIEDAQRRGEELCVAWLDLANAFGSVPHSHILGTLRLLGLPEEILSIIKDLYTESVTRAMTPDGLSDPIPILSGVKQGCPLSPIIFNLAMEPLIRAILKLKNSTGYRMIKQPPLGHVTNILAYADDLTLMAKNEMAMQKLIDVAVTVADWCSLHFKPPKCASLHLDRRRSGQQEVLPTEFEIQESPIVTLKKGEHYRHLGVPTGFRNDQTPLETIKEMEEKFTKLDESLLAPWQKIDAAITFLMPKMDFIMRGAEIAVEPLNQLDRHIKRIAKRWLFLPRRSSCEPVYMLPSQGGAGLLPLRDTRYIMAIVQGYRLLTSPDPFVQSLAWDSLREVVKIKIGRAPSNRDLVDYLNGKTKGDGGPRSFWARVRRSSMEMRKRCNVSWWWSETLEELQFLIPQPGAEPDEARVHPGARHHLCRLLRTAIRAHYIRRLLSKPDQGKVHSVSLLWSSSNHMMRSGAYTRFADWRFLHRARLDCVPLNATKRSGDGDKRCRRCAHRLETLPHVLSCCIKHSVARQQRHHNIVHRLARAVPTSNGLIVREDRRVPYSDSPLRPDVVVINEAKKELAIVDVAVVFENNYSQFQGARQQKIDKYLPLADSFRARGWNVHLDAVIVGSLGSWDPANEAALKILHIGRNYAKIMRKLIVSDTIRWSRDIYVEHITGQRQYAANPALQPPRLDEPTPATADPLSTVLNMPESAPESVEQPVTIHPNGDNSTSSAVATPSEEVATGKDAAANSGALDAPGPPGLHETTTQTDPPDLELPSIFDLFPSNHPD